MLKEFRDFINKGNVLDLAVAVIMGGAFGAIVTSLVNDIIMPVIGVIIGGIDFTSLKLFDLIAYGNFIQAVINFLIIAFVIFMIVRSLNNMTKKPEVKGPPPPPPPHPPLLPQNPELLKLQAKKNFL